MPEEAQPATETQAEEPASEATSEIEKPTTKQKRRFEWTPARKAAFDKARAKRAENCKKIQADKLKKYVENELVEKKSKKEATKKKKVVVVEESSESEDSESSVEVVIKRRQKKTKPEKRKPSPTPSSSESEDGHETPPDTRHLRAPQVDRASARHPAELVDYSKVISWL